VSQPERERVRPTSHDSPAFVSRNCALAVAEETFALFGEGGFLSCRRHSTSQSGARARLRKSRRSRLFASSPSIFAFPTGKKGNHLLLLREEEDDEDEGLAKETNAAASSPSASSGSTSERRSNSHGGSSSKDSGIDSIEKNGENDGLSEGNFFSWSEGISLWEFPFMVLKTGGNHKGISKGEFQGEMIKGIS